MMEELAAADAIIELVGANPPEGGVRGDTGEATMFGTYPRAYRRFMRIRDLGRLGAGEEALILARSLLSMIARAMWVDWSSDKAERVDRFNRWKKRELEDDIQEAKGLQVVGFAVDLDLTDYAKQLDELGNARAMPNDFDILKSMDLTAFYERVYRPGSRHLHYSLHHALDELIRAANSGEDLPLERVDEDLVAEALVVSILTYAMLLDAAEGTVKHGLTPRVAEILANSSAFSDLGEP